MVAWAPCATSEHASSMASTTTDHQLTFHDDEELFHLRLRQPQRGTRRPKCTIYACRTRRIVDLHTQHHPLSVQINNPMCASSVDGTLWRSTVMRSGRRARFSRRRLTAGAAQRATRLAVRRGLQGHRGRPSGLQSWPCGRSRRPRRACGGRAIFLNNHVPMRMTRATSRRWLSIHVSIVHIHTRPRVARDRSAEGLGGHGTVSEILPPSEWG